MQLACTSSAGTNKWTLCAGEHVSFPHRSQSTTVRHRREDLRKGRAQTRRRLTTLKDEEAKLKRASSVSTRQAHCTAACMQKTSGEQPGVKTALRGICWRMQQHCGHACSAVGGMVQALPRMPGPVRQKMLTLAIGGNGQLGEFCCRLYSGSQGNVVQPGR